ncbi:TolC family protein [Gaoshiqia sp. Z1-71]|uniref:TolC family protein n=1 Tax=Gaoshiqia hydrogeniformans TaxID=3290090 RepID=UPI003BF7CBA1
MIPTCPTANKFNPIIRRFVLLLFILPVLKPAQSQELFDLNKCISIGLERNFSIRVARNREEIAANNYSLGNAGHLPTLSMTNRYSGTVNQITQHDTDGEKSTLSGVHNTTGTAGVNLNWTIFQGFNARTSYQKLNEQQQLGELGTQTEVERLVSEIVSEYYFYVQQQRLYHNLAYAVSLSRERVRIDEERYLLGSSSKLELLQSIVYLNADSSRYARQKEVLRASQVRLNELMAADDPGGNIQLEDSVIHIDEKLLYDRLLDLTLNYNTSLQIAKKNRVISELDHKLIASRAYPYLNFSSGYALAYNTYDAGSLSNQRTNGMNYGLTLGMDLFDGYNRRREKTNAVLEIENKKYQYQEIEQQIRADLITIYYAYENNLQLLRLEEQNLSVARENLEIALERYKLGNLSGLELREVQKSLLDAEERLISVQYQTKLAEISLQQISGRIMDYL